MEDTTKTKYKFLSENYTSEMKNSISEINRLVKEEKISDH